MRTTIVNKQEKYCEILITIENAGELKMLLEKFSLPYNKAYPILNTIPEDSVHRKLVELKNFYKL